MNDVKERNHSRFENAESRRERAARGREMSALSHFQDISSGTRLSELEVFCPELFLRAHPEAAQQVATAVAKDLLADFADS